MAYLTDHLETLYNIIRYAQYNDVSEINVKNHSDVWVTASQIGNAAYCPYQLYLKESGVTPDKSAVVRMKKGNQAHDRYSKNKIKKGSTNIIGTWLLSVALFSIFFIIIVKLIW